MPWTTKQPFIMCAPAAVHQVALQCACHEIPLMPLLNLGCGGVGARTRSCLLGMARRRPRIRQRAIQTAILRGRRDPERDPERDPKRGLERDPERDPERVLERDQ